MNEYSYIFFKLEIYIYRERESLKNGTDEPICLAATEMQI